MWLKERVRLALRDGEKDQVVVAVRDGGDRVGVQLAVSLPEGVPVNDAEVLRNGVGSAHWEVRDTGCGGGGGARKRGRRQKRRGRKNNTRRRGEGRAGEM